MESISTQVVSTELYLNFLDVVGFENQFNITSRIALPNAFLATAFRQFIRSTSYLEVPHFFPIRLRVCCTLPMYYSPLQATSRMTIGSPTQLVVAFDTSTRDDGTRSGKALCIGLRSDMS